jgi:hypothetical protein
VVPERPASASESVAKPRGPLPGGATGGGPSPESDDGKASSKEAGRTSAAGKGQAAAKDEKARPKGDAVGKERRHTVKVIVGTRRYHSTDCPLIQGAGDGGVETMTLAQAEDAGLTSCSVCQHDHESIA